MRFGRGRIGKGRAFTATLKPDALALILAELPDGEWSDNVALNTYIDIVERRKSDTDFATYYAVSGTVGVNSENPWAYSSGCYVPSRRLYYFSGGGHDDWLGSECGKLDLRTLTWTRTDESAKVKQNDNDPTAPFDPTDSLGWKAWRNPSGRYAPLSSHMYGGMIYVPGLDKVHVQGSATYRSGQGGPGGFMWIDPDTGHWDENGAHAAGSGGVNVMSVVVPTVHIVDSSLNPTGATLSNCVFRASFPGSEPQGFLVDPVNKTMQKTVGFWSASHRPTSAGCVVPDPINSGRLAYVADRDESSLAVFPMIDFMRNDGATHASVQALSYGNEKPEALGNGSSTRWINMGEYIEGCTKIAVFKMGVGLYALDRTDWTWSSLIVEAPYSDPSDGCWKRFEYFPDYDCFGLFGHLGQALYVLQRPVEFA